MRGRNFGRGEREEARVARRKGKGLRTDLGHLPPAKRAELAFAVEVLKEELAKSLATRQAPELASGSILKIILFGSYARGDWVEDPVGRYFSDFDLLVVVSDERLTDAWELWEGAEKRLLSELVSGQRLRTPVSFVVHSLEDVNRQLELGRYFWVDVMRDGVVLLDTPGAELVEPRPMSADVAWAEASAYAEEARQFVERHLKVFDMQTREGVEDLGWRRDAAFTLHQTAEQLYHCLLMVFTLYIPKSHNLIFLRKRTDQFDPRLRDVWPTDTKFQKRSFELLRAAYVKARYSPHYRVSTEELEWLASRVRLLDRVVSDCCATRLSDLRAEADAV